MATLETYRKYIQELLTEDYKLVWEDRIKAETIFDTERDRYQLVYVVFAPQIKLKPLQTQREEESPISKKFQFSSSGSK